MKAYLAGFNVDATVLRELQEVAGKRQDITPEVLSAAYARISRDPRPINEIREFARSEVERSRKSNSTIIFKMGHHSVAEHAVFNLDILGVSRYVMEELEKFRLCSYTEKSQRYITLDEDFVLPLEIKGTDFEDEFIQVIKLQNKTYFDLYVQLKSLVFKKHSDLAKDPKKHTLLEGWAKEDARYITALATESQVGMTINARNLELMLRRFASHPLEEVKTLGRIIYAQISEVAPSIVIFHQANDYDLKTYPALKELASEFVFKHQPEPQLQEKDVELVGSTPRADHVVAASIVHSSTSLSFEQALDLVERKDPKELKSIFQTASKNLQFYDSVLREFEYISLTYDIILSAACFGQLKRHRMSTITVQAYDPQLGVTVPESIKEIGLDKKFMEVIEQTNRVYDSIAGKNPLAAPYTLTNSHRRRALMKVNAREMYHISRLREDSHAQWDIRNISRAMSEKAKKIMPLTFALIGGKDKYSDIYQVFYGYAPKIIEADLPGSRNIK